MSVTPASASNGKACFYGGYLDQSDAASLAATFLDASHAELGSVTVGGVKKEDRKNVTALLPREATGGIPARTREVRLTLTFTKEAEGNFSDGSADNLSFVVNVRP